MPVFMPDGGFALSGQRSSAGERGTRRPGKRSAAGQDDGSVAKRTNSRCLTSAASMARRRRIFQRIAKMVGAQRQMGG
ncbi:hypothetical protein LNO89_05445 [Klebsiella pneumoniae subsp. pneumoniae]|nr:hypothetical protein [Klebsiella pneumoniae subsp. pneumoniae]